MAKTMELGGGGRFAQLKKKLAAGGARKPGALAAAIGRRKYGSSKMQKWANANRKEALAAYK